MNHNRIAITRDVFEGKELELLLYLDDHNRPIEFHSYSLESPSLVGNIYVARVSQVMEQLNGAFLQAGDLKFYYPIEDLSRIIFTKKQGNPNKLCQGDELVVQVVRDAIKTKEICVSTNISLSSEHLLVTTGNLVNGVSKKIPQEKRREIKAFLENFDDTSYGFVVRTRAATAKMEELQQEIAELDEIYKDFMAHIIHKSVGSLVYEAMHPFIHHIKRLVQEGCQEIVSDQIFWVEKTKETLSTDVNVRLYADDSYPMKKLYSIAKIMRDITNKQVYLPSGGSLVIEHTEALTVVDVNSGKNTKKMSRNDYFYANNKEAAKEIARQLRLRNISGMILIDFINMSDTKQRQDLLSLLKNEAKHDYVTVSVLDYTKLGLVEMTREKKYPSVREQLS